MASLMLDCAAPARADTDLAHASSTFFLLTEDIIHAAIQSTGGCNFGRVLQQQRPVFADSVKDIGAFQRGRGTVAARFSLPASPRHRRLLTITRILTCAATGAQGCLTPSAPQV
jgi:hypothetical protein